MTGNGRPLPEFSRPPLVEVAISIQFEPIQLRAAHFGLFWQKIRSRFPRTSEQGPLQPAIERFGVRNPAQPQMQFAVGVLLPRLWFMNSEETELIQLQSDRIVHNWRKQGNESAEYPRYRKLRDDLEQEYALLTRFLADEHLGPLVPNQCELTYVNQVEMKGNASGSLNALGILALERTTPADPFLPEPENASVNLSFIMPGGSAGVPAGRLYITCAPSVRISDNTPMNQLQVICRGAPDGQGADAVFRFMDVAHDWAVRGFTSITSTEMHTQWGRVR